jgi:hypothetical protein
LTVAFYSDLYRHFGIFRSAPAFYQLSMAFLRRASATIIAQATECSAWLPVNYRDGADSCWPAGRCEYSPFCPLRILLVHGDVAASQLQTIASSAIHFTQDLRTPVTIDPVVTRATQLTALADGASA